MLNLTALCSISAFNPTNHRTAQNYSPVSLFDHNTQSLCFLLYRVQSHCNNLLYNVQYTVSLLKLCVLNHFAQSYYASVMLHTTARLTAQSHCLIELLNPNTLPYCSILLFNLSAQSYCSILQINSTA